MDNEVTLTKSCRLYPTKQQADYFWLALRTTTHMYNKSKEWSDAYYEATGGTLSRKDLDSLAKSYRDEVLLDQHLYRLEYHTFRHGVTRFFNARRDFLRGIRGRPKFQSGKGKRVRSFYIRIDGERSRTLLQEGSPLVKIPGLAVTGNSLVRSNILKTKYPFIGDVRSARIVWDGKYWNLQWVTTLLYPGVPESDPIGVDFGLPHLAVDSDGYAIDKDTSPRFQRLLKRERGLQRKLQRQRDSKVIGSNYHKTLRSLQTAHRSIAAYKKHQEIKAAKLLLSERPSTVVLEDLDIAKMKSKEGNPPSLRSQIHQVGWYSFRLRVEHEVSKYGGRVVIADKYFPSTRTCSNCGHVKDHPIPLDIRWYYCYECSFETDRDLNSALNLKALA